MDPFGLYAENALANLGIPTIEQDWSTDVAACTVVSTIGVRDARVMGALHYAKWIRDEHPDAMRGFYQVSMRLQRERRRRG